MELRSITFTKSSPDLKSCPGEGFPEYAFAGRSNVGKSSLLNLLAGIHNLAKTSSTPGKTQLINHFIVNEAWYMVDLPGYGFSRTSKKTSHLFLSAVHDYLLHRQTLACLFILLDCRHQPLKNDLEFIQWAGQNQLPIALIFTKADKLSTTSLHAGIEKYKKTLLETWEELPAIFTTSSLLNSGREEILNFIEQTNRNFHTNRKMFC
jgi:GTP-binding protein